MRRRRRQHTNQTTSARARGSERRVCVCVWRGQTRWENRRRRGIRALGVEYTSVVAVFSLLLFKIIKIYNIKKLYFVRVASFISSYIGGPLYPPPPPPDVSYRKRVAAAAVEHLNLKHCAPGRLQQSVFTLVARTGQRRAIDTRTNGGTGNKRLPRSATSCEQIDLFVLSLSTSLPNSSYSSNPWAFTQRGGGYKDRFPPRPFFLDSQCSEEAVGFHMSRVFSRSKC